MESVNEANIPEISFSEACLTLLTSPDYTEHRQLGLALGTLFILIGMLVWG